MLEHALTYARRGWPVFPCTPSGKFPLTPNGFKDATTDESVIRVWWRNWPSANIGVPTGKTSGLFVVDIDAKNGGLDSFSELRREHGEFATYTVATGGGGLHFYFKYPPDEDLRNKAGLWPGIDIRGEGGYVIAPPSIHESGKSYRVATENIPPQVPPDWIKSKTTEKKHVPTPTELAENSATIGIGGRNEYMWQLACKLRRTGLSEHAIYVALSSTNLDICEPPLTDFALCDIAKRVATYTPGDPVILNLGATGNVLPAGELFPLAKGALLDSERMKGISTGYPDLDVLLGGGKRLGELTIWHAEAKTGKNTLWHVMMHKMLELGTPLAYASCELDPATEVIPQLWATHFQKDVWTICDDGLTDEQWEEYKAKLSSWPLYFSVEQDYFPMEQVEKWVDDCIQKGIKYFWFDHLHRMIEEEDYVLAGRMIRRLKSLARQKNIHVDMIVQPTKLVNGTGVSTQSIKGGSSIVQTADNFITMERGIDDLPENVTKVELVRKRFRKAKQGSIYLMYDPDTYQIVICDVNKKTSNAPKQPPTYNKNIDY